MSESANIFFYLLPILWIKSDRTIQSIVKLHDLHYITDDMINYHSKSHLYAITEFCLPLLVPVAELKYIFIDLFVWILHGKTSMLWNPKYLQQNKHSIKLCPIITSDLKNWSKLLTILVQHQVSYIAQVWNLPANISTLTMLTQTRIIENYKLFAIVVNEFLKDFFSFSRVHYFIYKVPFL